MAGYFTKEEIAWIKSYREQNECGLQTAKKVLLVNRIDKNIEMCNDPILKQILKDMLELIRY